jgi:hypothetical protein
MHTERTRCVFLHLFSELVLLGENGVTIGVRGAWVGDQVIMGTVYNAF